METGRVRRSKLPNPMKRFLSVALMGTALFNLHAETKGDDGWQN